MKLTPAARIWILVAVFLVIGAGILIVNLPDWIGDDSPRSTSSEETYVAVGDDEASVQLRTGLTVESLTGGEAHPEAYAAVTDWISESAGDGRVGIGNYIFCYREDVGESTRWYWLILRTDVPVAEYGYHPEVLRDEDDYIVRLTYRDKGLVDADARADFILLTATLPAGADAMPELIQTVQATGESEELDFLLTYTNVKFVP